jgi:HEAT repeat protein
MRGMILASLISFGATAWLPAVAPVPYSDEEALLRHNKIPTDGVAAMAYVRQRLAPIDTGRVKRLISQLGDDSFTVREEASRQLLLLGGRVRRQLQEAARHEDPEVRTRADTCLRQVEKENIGSALLGAAVRVVGYRAPAGATAYFMDLLPGVEDEALSSPIRLALADLAVRGGKADPVLVKALSSDLAWRRQVAVTALCKGGAGDQLPALRKLLGDADKSVRLAAALGLVALHQKEAVSALIDFMDQPHNGDVAMAEEILFRLADDKSPQLPDDSPASRKKYREAWQTWWKASGPGIDLAALDAATRPKGYTLVVMLDDNEVVSLDAANKVRWKFNGVEMPLDIEALPGDRVLLAEYKGNRVTERNSKGEVVWEKKIVAPLVAQRLPNGNTFIATATGLIEVDRAGKEVSNIPPPVGQAVMRARKLPSGELLLICQLGTVRCFRLDRFGKELRSFGVEVATSGGRLDVTARGELLIPELTNDRVLVLDRDGKMIRQVGVSQPISALALPGGKILVTSMQQKRAIEFDRAGKEVWQYKRDSRVTRAVRY